MKLYHPHFFTATILGWQHLLQPEKYKNIIINSLRFLVTNNRVTIYCFVIMPNHIHIIWQMNDDILLENVQRDFLKYTAQQIKADLIENHPLVLDKFRVDKKDRKYQFWKHRPLSVPLWNNEVLLQKLDYIHNNPLQEKWKLADLPENYKFSSASFYILNQTEFDFLTHYND